MPVSEPRTHTHTRAHARTRTHTHAHAHARTHTHTITNLLATQGENDDHPSPARAYTTSSHTIHIATPTPPDGIREALTAYREAIGAADFPFLAFFTHDPRHEEAGLQWVAPEIIKLAPAAPTPQQQEPTDTYWITPDTDVIIEVTGITPLLTKANTDSLGEIFDHFRLPHTARLDALVWVRDGLNAGAPSKSGHPSTTMHDQQRAHPDLGLLSKRARLQVT